MKEGVMGKGYNGSNVVKVEGYSDKRPRKIQGGEVRVEGRGKSSECRPGFVNCIEVIVVVVLLLS